MRKKLYYKGSQVDHVEVVFSKPHIGYNSGESAWFPISVARGFVRLKVGSIKGEQAEEPVVEEEKPRKPKAPKKGHKKVTK